MASVCDVPGIAQVCSTVGQSAASLVQAPFDWLASALGSAASWMVGQIWSVFEGTALVDVTNTGYRKVFALVFGIACMLMLLLFCIQVLSAIIRHEAAGLARAVTGLAKAVLGSFLLLTLTGLLLTITDQLCTGIVQATGQTIKGMRDRLAGLFLGLSALTITGPGAGTIIQIFLAGLVIAAAFIVWLSLIVRKALVLVGLVFGPVALSGAVWEHGKSRVSKWVSFIIAMIVSKLVLVIILLIGVQMAASPLEPDLQTVGDIATGLVILLIGAFAPYMSYKFIGFIGADMYQLMSVEQEAKQALDRPIPIRPTIASPGNAGSTSTGTASTSGRTPGGVVTQTSTTSADATSGSTGVGGAAASGSAGVDAAGGSAGSAAAGPAAAVVLGAEALKQTVTAGAKAGDAVASAADSRMADAVQPEPQLGHIPTRGLPITDTAPAAVAPPARAEIPPATDGQG